MGEREGEEHIFTARRIARASAVTSVLSLFASLPLLAVPTVLNEDPEERRLQPHHLPQLPSRVVLAMQCQACAQLEEIS